MGHLLSARRVVCCSVVSLCVIASSATAVSGATTSTDQKTAAAGKLVLQDVPTGWRETPDTSDEAKTDAAMAEVPACKKWLAARKSVRTLPNAQSAKFTSGDDVASNQVYVFPSVVKARQTMKLYRSAQTRACLQTSLENFMEASAAANSQVSDVAVTVGPENVEPIGDEVSAYATGISATYKSGLSESVYVESEAVRIGRVVSVFAFQSNVDDYPLSNIAPDAMSRSLDRIPATT